MTPRRGTTPRKLPPSMSDFLYKLEGGTKVELSKAQFEALFEQAMAEAEQLEIADLWEQRDRGITYWVLLMTGMNQDEEMGIANSLLSWKAFLAKDAAWVRCIQTSDKREFACCQSRFGPITCPTLAVGYSPNLDSFITIGPELLFKIASAPGCVHRFLTKLHHLVETSPNLRDIEGAIKTPPLWNAIHFHFDAVKELVAHAVTASWQGENQVLFRKHLWMPGGFVELTTLVDRDAPELEAVLKPAREALGPEFGKVLGMAYATGDRDVASEVYDAVRFTTRLKYDRGPANPGEPQQKVRLARKVLRDRVGTCLDLALLLAALLEHARCAPAILIVERKDRWHAIGGFFDNGAEASTPDVVTDPVTIRKLLYDRLLVAVDATGLCVTKGKKKDYAQACKEADSLVINDRPLALVNVVAARKKGFKPPG
jgi:hypothetical protein